MSDSKSDFLKALSSSYEEERKTSNKVVSVQVIAISFDGIPVKKRKASDFRKENLREKKDGKTVKPKVIHRIVTPETSEAFLCAMQKAAKKQGDERKNLEREAIESFNGYSFGEPHGTQCDNALRKAKASFLGTGPDIQKQEYHGGFVAGMPDFEQKRVRDLNARISESLDRMKEANEKGDELTAALEAERIQAIQKQY